MGLSVFGAMLLCDILVWKVCKLTIQPQLLQVALDPIDVVYTPDWVARDMVEFFRPDGTILDPSSGDGVFLKYLPSSEWCEIEKGRDFFSWNTPVDWLFGNPPYSQFSEWLDHSMSIAKNICYLVPCNKAFNSYSMIERVSEWGGMRHMRVYGPGSRLKFPIGYAIGAIHYQRDYSGAMGISIFELSRPHYRP